MIDVNTQIMLILAILFFATFIRTIFGFGDALLAMPTLALLIDVKTATPIVALISTLIGFIIIYHSWRNIEFASARRLIISSIPGIIIGLFLLKGVNDNLMKILLALVIISFALYKLLIKKTHILKTEKTSYFFGFLSGILGGAYNTSGPPIIIYGTLRQWSPTTFRTTIQGYFIVTEILILLGHYSSGFWSREVISISAISIPVVLLGYFLGNIIHNRISVKKFNKYIYGLLLIIGVLLFVTNI